MAAGNHHRLPLHTRALARNRLELALAEHTALVEHIELAVGIALELVARNTPPMGLRKLAPSKLATVALVEHTLAVAVELVEHTLAVAVALVEHTLAVAIGLGPGRLATAAALVVELGKQVVVVEPFVAEPELELASSAELALERPVLAERKPAGLASAGLELGLASAGLELGL